MESEPLNASCPRRAGPIRVVVVDDHDAVRTGLERVLERSPGFASVSAIEDDRDLFALLKREHIDVVVLDYDLERTDGLSLCLRMKERRESPAIVIYSGYAAPSLALAAGVAQADALVHKAEPIEMLLGSLRRLASGEKLLGTPSPELIEAAAARLDAADLPVMALLIARTRPAQIARALALEETEVVRRAHRIVRELQGGRPRGRQGRTAQASSRWTTRPSSSK
jgi:DNA-binding NarL/FixJ family response regulator